MSGTARWIVVNPTAGSGHAGRLGQELEKHLPLAELKTTTQTGDATRLAREARKQGVDTIIAVGGDGTIHECVSGLLLDDDGTTASGATKLAVCPAGTGGDFRKTFGWSESIHQAVTRIEHQQVRKIDAGIAEFEGVHDARPAVFVNVLSFGLGGLTDRMVADSPKWVGGRTAYFLGAFRANLAHQPVPIELEIDGTVVETAPYSNVAICNGRYFGGGMMIAPEADPTDGTFDVVTMELSRAATMTLATSIYRGTHLRRPDVKHYRCSRIRARVTRAGESLIDVDGEQLGRLPLSVRVLPNAIDLLT